MSLSTHVLDSATGRPAGAVPVRLERFDASDWAQVVARCTDDDGRISDLAPDCPPGVYRLRFDVQAHYGADAFFPEVVIVFRVVSQDEHLHVPLLLSPFAYSTYRGS